MAILKGYLSIERSDILFRKNELDVGLELLERGYKERNKEIADAGVRHTKKYLDMDVSKLSIVGLYHWGRITDNFYMRYYSMVRDLDAGDIALTLEVGESETYFKDITKIN